ncbi:thermonuclease family protein [Agrobacterium tumefaciens]|uniref:thermonuclease family protein n=1 Tax=Agrobacterium tumefaciens TaxID=358 RepID=UPI001F315982
MPTHRSAHLGWRHLSSGSSRGESVRIFNIDAPEIEGRCRYESDLAQQSKRRLAERLEGQRVHINRQHRDRYGRTLAAITFNGHDIGDQLVSEALAILGRGAAAASLGAKYRLILKPA